MSLPDLRVGLPRAPRAPLMDARGVYEHEGTPVAYVRPSRRGWMMAEIGGRERFYPKRKAAREAARGVVEEHAYRVRERERRRVDRRRGRRDGLETVAWGVAWTMAVVALMVVLAFWVTLPETKAPICAESQTSVCWEANGGRLSLRDQEGLWPEASDAVWAVRAVTADEACRKLGIHRQVWGADSESDCD